MITGKIYKFDSSAIDTLYDSNPEKFKKFICGEVVCKLNEVIDAVNKHSDIIQQIGDWGTRKGECLWCEKITKVNLEK